MADKIQAEKHKSGPALVTDLLLMGGNLAFCMAKHHVQEIILNWLHGDSSRKRRAN